ncbi:MAG: DUF302 domain-containing protein [Hyphomicrobiales bacterium]|nr:DUF302 domain-containing protein [Hyphomicrobiales bacterium]
MINRRDGLLAGLGFGMLGAMGAEAATPGVVTDKGLGVVSRKLVAGLSAKDAAQSMESTADNANIKLVTTLALSQQVAAMTGKKQRLMTIYLFCDPLIAQDMVDANPLFAAFMPCRIAMVEDASGSLSLVMMDLDPLVAAAPAALQPKAKHIRDVLMHIMEAGANGDL